MAVPSEQLLRELGRYLVHHHARQQELPLEVGTTFHRRVQRRCGKGPQAPPGQEQEQQHQAYPALCAASPGALLDAVQQLAELECAKVERLTAGPKTLTMLTWVGGAEITRLLGGWEGQAGVVMQTVTGGPAAVAAAAAAPEAANATFPQRKKPRVDEPSDANAEVPVRHPLQHSPLQPPQPSPAQGKKETVADILGKPTALEALAAERFKKHAPVVREFCQHRTKAECDARLLFAGGGSTPARCTKLHFRRVVESHTDVSLGDCAYLSTCRRARTCKYIHYAIEDEAPSPSSPEAAPAAAVGEPSGAMATALQLLPPAQGPPVSPKPPAQWANTDVREFDLSVLGQFAVIMADPPWEIHMDLPYGTMKDDEVAKLNFPKLQERDGGLLFLWVTGRAMERAREIFDYWGYRQVEEIVWIKTNQLQKVIRTGRTGHWLNHSKEHCLVGVKGQPRGLNRYLDCDVIVAEARETSRKPDEIYDIIERLSPGTRKVEIFGRRHNIRDGWVTVGNQLPPTRLLEPDVVARYHAWRAEGPEGGGLKVLRDGRYV